MRCHRTLMAAFQRGRHVCRPADRQAGLMDCCFSQSSLHRASLARGVTVDLNRWVAERAGHQRPQVQRLPAHGRPGDGLAGHGDGAQLHVRRRGVDSSLQTTAEGEQ